MRGGYGDTFVVSLSLSKMVVGAVVCKSEAYISEACSSVERRVLYRDLVNELVLFYFCNSSQ